MRELIFDGLEPRSIENGDLDEEISLVVTNNLCRATGAKFEPIKRRVDSKINCWRRMLMAMVEQKPFSPLDFTKQLKQELNKQKGKEKEKHSSSDESDGEGLFEEDSETEQDQSRKRKSASSSSQKSNSQKKRK